MKKSLSLIPAERIQKHIFLLRGQKVMLSQHLAELYGTPGDSLMQLSESTDFALEETGACPAFRNGLSFFE